MNNTTIKQRIETITRNQVMQTIVDEIAMSATIYAEIIGETQLTKDVAEFGFSVLTDEGYEDVVGCFYREDDVDTLMIYIDSKTIETALVNLDNKSITITFADGITLYVEFV